MRLTGLFTKIGLFIILLVIIALNGYATHQRSAEISLAHVSGNTFDVSITTFTFTPSPADRPDMLIHWGDGTQDVLIRTEKTILPNQVTRNIYAYNPEMGALAARHTFPSSGTYTVWIEDANRNYGILNIPNSINIPIYVETSITINPFIGINSTPMMLNPPLDNACAGYPWYYNAGAVDVDGDSLSFELVNCRGHLGEPIPGYTLPQSSEGFSIDSISGMVAWLNPVLQGEYNIAIKVTEWRHGNKIGSVLRDMQIIVAACNNLPPQIIHCADTCIMVGQRLQLDLKAFDSDNDVVTITASGLPFQQSFNPGILVIEPDTTTCFAKFIWTPNCNQVAKKPYQLLIKATDNAQPIQRSSYKLVNIKVIYPPPSLKEITPTGKSIHLKWEQGICKTATSFEVYRSIGPGSVPDVCTTGLQSTEYTYLTTTSDSTYSDTNQGLGLQGGITYCYRIVANHLPDFKSMASNTLCATLKKDLPVITHVSFDTSNHEESILKIGWSAPTELDTLQHPGPYGYQVFEQKPFTTDWNPITDTIAFTDTTLYRTVARPETLLDWYRYKIAFYNLAPGASYLIGVSDLASSEFLTATPSDYSAQLQWRAAIPWNTTTYRISRKQAIEDEWDWIASTTDRYYTDTALVNGQTYFYKITALGSYNTSGYTNPLINHSETIEIVPIDNVAPCPPKCSHSTNCVASSLTINLQFDNAECANDAVLYKVYSQNNGEFELITTAEPPIQQIIIPYLPGLCYSITVVDEANNASEPSTLDCALAEECLPSMLIPNVLTPNADGFNDELLVSIMGNFQSTSFTIVNRWGITVFETSDPQVRWDGTYQGGNQCPTGTYFYIATIHFTTSNGMQQKQYSGALELLR